MLECALRGSDGTHYTHVLWDRIFTDPKEAVIGLKGARKDTYRLYVPVDRLASPANITVYYDITPIGGVIYRMQGPRISHLLKADDAKK
ncbi:MAG: hypothetical protein Q8P67_23825 [archaeon]|nr:hypothetical protein [archaeon]